MPTVHDPKSDAEIAALIFGLGGQALDVRAVSKRLKIGVPEVFEALARRKVAFDAAEIAQLRGERRPNARANATPATYTLRGRSQTLRAWCAELGVSPGEVQARLDRGDTLSHALGAGLPACGVPDALYELDGEERTLAEWAAVTGLRANTIRDRLRGGWTVRETLSTPAGVRRQVVTAAVFRGAEFAGYRVGPAEARAGAGEWQA